MNFWKALWWHLTGKARPLKLCDYCSRGRHSTHDVNSSKCIFSYCECQVRW